MNNNERIDTLNAIVDGFCARLRQERELRGMTRAQMADFLGLYKGTYTSYENHSIPSVTVMIQIAKKLGRSLDYLCGLDDTKGEAK